MIEIAEMQKKIEKMLGMGWFTYQTQDEISQKIWSVEPSTKAPGKSSWSPLALHVEVGFCP